MGTIIDSLKILKASNDSLHKVLGNEQLLPFKTGEPAVQAAIIIASTTVLTVALGFLIKDYWIPILTEKRSKKKEGQELFIRYKYYLFTSARLFVRRLHEIYDHRAHYLWINAPRSEFYDYKYKSSVYRLCVLLGWLRAYHLESSSISIDDSDEKMHTITVAIEKFRRSLADGQGIEMYVAKKICALNGITIESIDEKILLELSVEIDHLIQVFSAKYDKNYMSLLTDEQKELFLNDLAALMNRLKLNNAAMNGNKENIIKEVSIKFGLLFHDWQEAIGDLMLEVINNKDGHSYGIIGYKRFEEMWSMDKTSAEKKWLMRAETMFENLDLRVDEGSDSRIQQFRGVYACVYTLLQEFYRIELGVKPISIEEFNRIAPTINA